MTDLLYTFLLGIISGFLIYHILKTIWGKNEPEKETAVIETIIENPRVTKQLKRANFHLQRLFHNPEDVEKRQTIRIVNQNSKLLKEIKYGTPSDGESNSEEPARSD